MSTSVGSISAYCTRVSEILTLVSSSHHSESFLLVYSFGYDL